MRNIQMPPTQTTYFPLRGGLNLITPPLSLPDGVCRDALNFEVGIDGGYTRVSGYERLDGQTPPSEANLYSIPVMFIGAVAVGDVITGATSGATGVVCGSGTDYIAFTKYVGTFNPAEDLEVSAVPVATSTSGALNGVTDTPLIGAMLQSEASDIYRADIDAVPGSGSILGVVRYKGIEYAFRNNAGGTAAELYKSSSSGWVKVDLGYEVAFSNANTSVGDGDTLSQGGVTATIAKVVVETGTLASGTNTGKLIISAPAGGNFAAGAASSTGGGSLTLSGAQNAITLLPDGRYEFDIKNFGGQSATRKLYGCDGVNWCFEFDGTIFVPIKTGMSPDTPSHIKVHQKHLFAMFGGSVQNSSIGAPYMWTAITGAAEIALGDDGTGFLTLKGSDSTAALAIFTRNMTYILYGTSSADFNLVNYSEESGAFEYTAQNINQAFVADQVGIRMLQATQDYGNFSDSQISNLIRPFFNDRATRIIASCTVRRKNQYRLMFNDRYAIYATFSSGKLVGMMPILYAHTMTCSFSEEGDDGNEYVLCGDTSGYVYRMERGTSFDGEEIEAYLIPAFNHIKSPRLRKRYRKAVYEVTGGGYAEFEASFELGYGSSDIPQGATSSLASTLDATFWDLFVWDAFYWDGRTLLPIEHGLDGTAENISTIIRSTSKYFQSFTFNSVILHYTPRRNLR